MIQHGKLGGVCSHYAMLDLLDKSENKSEDVISILEHIHNKFIPRTDDDDPVVIKRKVFGGDVLTNERAYSTQLAMLNHATDYQHI
jgi:DNA-directed RNA polymerase subunit H (RpoH/RPB5)